MIESTVLYLKFSYALLFPFFCGFIFIWGVWQKNLDELSFLFTGSLSYLIGAGFLPLAMLLWGWMGFQWNVFGISGMSLIVSFLLSMLFHFLKHRCDHAKNAIRSARDLQKNNFLYWAVLIFFSILGPLIFTIIFIRAMQMPLVEFDTLATAGFQAKVFFYSNSLELHPFIPHASFPLQLPFLLTWLSLNLGFWEPQLSKIFCPLILLAGCTVYFCVFQRVLGRTAGFLGVVLILSSPFLVFHATVAYRDIILMNYLCGAIGLLILWYFQGDQRILCVSAVFAGLATFTKLEGVLYAVVYGLFFIILFVKKGYVKKTFTPLKIVLSMLILLCGLYFVYKTSSGILLNEKGGLCFDIHNVLRLPEIFKRFAVELFCRPCWGMVMIVFLLTLFSNVTKLFRFKEPSIFFVLSLTLFFSAIIAVALFSRNAQTFHDLISCATLPRIILHFFPLFVFSIVCFLFEGNEYGS